MEFLSSERRISRPYDLSMILRDAAAVCHRRLGGHRRPLLPVWSPLLHLSKRHNHHVVHNRPPFRLAIIGSGPAGFYAAYRVMSRIENAVVDMYERLPVPYGLVRFGVAPDHPEVKNCQDKFTDVASSPRFNFIGNLDIGNDLPLPSMLPHYNAILFAYGASQDRRLGIPGEDQLEGIYSARGFVGWYNGLPEYANLSPRLDLGEEAIIIGQGNVALDIARTLLSDVDRLRKTDITERALAALSASKVKRVRIVGRRGPMQASFTIKEIRELMTLEGVAFEPIDSSLFPRDPTKLPRVQKRLTQLLMKGSSNTPSPPAQKSWSLDFLQSPTSFVGGPPPHNSTRLTAMTFAKTAFQSPDHSDPSAKVQPTGETTTMSTSLAFRSIGYKSEALPGMKQLGIPFDDSTGTIPTASNGRIVASSLGAEGPVTYIPGMYCTGWVKNGPTGVIATTMDDAFASAEAIAGDWEGGISLRDSNVTEPIKGGWDSLKTEAAIRSRQTVSWEDWQTIDAEERRRGQIRGKEREKFTSIPEMLNLLR
ncbi:NADPH-adrenodoxin reductase [Xylographa opegraphella]|nr:NADPH-adrenodoxin reductase [Xylographa opegraphella]